MKTSYFIAKFYFQERKKERKKKKENHLYEQFKKLKLKRYTYHRTKSVLGHLQRNSICSITVSQSGSSFLYSICKHFKT